jgi:hypothetical protein
MKFSAIEPNRVGIAFLATHFLNERSSRPEWVFRFAPVAPF